MMGYFLDNFCEISYFPFRYTGTIITFQLDKYVAIIVLVIIIKEALFFTNLLPNSHTSWGKTKCIVMVSMEKMY